MSVLSSITVNDRHGKALLVEFDGTQMNAFIGTAGLESDSVAIELDETDRSRLRDFLAVNCR